MRLLSDTIRADEIIDEREILFLNSIKHKYGINKEDEFKSDAITLSQAIQTLKNASYSLSNNIIADITQIAMSDNYCARPEALLLITLTTTLTNKFGEYASIVSIDSTGLHLDEAQILYIESFYHQTTNDIIKKYYKQLHAESQLIGFDFVYIPKIAEHYQSLHKTSLINIISFLYPCISQQWLESVVQQIQNLSTSTFCKEQLSEKLSIKELFDVPPSLFINVGNSCVNNKSYANFLILELDNDIISTFHNFIDLFSSLYQTKILNYRREEKGRFVYTGFYRQILDLHMLQKGVKSTILIDTIKGEIFFPEADLKIEKLHRREKALYALFIIESTSGGINFEKPKNTQQLARYEKRMKILQKRYSLIYKKFGGEEALAPDISVSQIRLPMISLIKRQISKLGDILFHINDYLIQRNPYGHYNIGIDIQNCFCYTDEKAEPINILESSSWNKIRNL